MHSHATARGMCCVCGCVCVVMNVLYCKAFRASLNNKTKTNVPVSSRHPHVCADGGRRGRAFVSARQRNRGFLRLGFFCWSTVRGWCWCRRTKPVCCSAHCCCLDGVMAVVVVCLCFVPWPLWAMTSETETYRTVRE